MKLEFHLVRAVLSRSPLVICTRIGTVNATMAKAGFLLIACSRPPGVSRGLYCMLRNHDERYDSAFTSQPKSMSAGRESLCTHLSKKVNDDHGSPPERSLEDVALFQNNQRRHLIVQSNNTSDETALSCPPQHILFKKVHSYIPFLWTVFEHTAEFVIISCEF